MKGSSEPVVRDALRRIDLQGLIVYKPADDSRNWKPADYLLWFPWMLHGWDAITRSVWLEVKDVDAVNVFPRADIRPAQREGIRASLAANVRYYLVVRWRKRQTWTVSDAAAVLEAIEAGERMTFDLMASKYGSDSTTAMLPSVLKNVLMEGF